MTEKEVKQVPVDIPNESGEINFKVLVKPVSFQASRSKKKSFVKAIRNITEPIQYLLSGDVAVELTWFINEDERYESDEPADVDNIIKPILDALSGPDGMLINDCQVQYLSSHWVDRYNEDEYIQIKIKYEPDAYIEKDKIMFVQLQKAICMPLPDNLKPEELKSFLDIYEMQLNSRDKELEQGASYYQAKRFMSIQRLFHKTRVRNFKVTKVEDLRASIKDSV